MSVFLESNAAAAAPVVLAALREHLGGLRHVVAALPASRYTAVPSAVSGSVGAHVRHCLDHVRAVLHRRGGDELSYDARLRGTQVERDPEAAIAAIDMLCRELEGVDAREFGTEVQLRTVVGRAAPPVLLATTTGRELAFVIQHTVHHSAVIALLVERLGAAVPPGFGYAPSTPRPA